MRGAVQSGDESKRGEESSRVESGLSLSSREEGGQAVSGRGWVVEWSGVETASRAGRQAGRFRWYGRPTMGYWYW